MIVETAITHSIKWPPYVNASTWGSWLMKEPARFFSVFWAPHPAKFFIVTSKIQKVLYSPSTGPSGSFFSQNSFFHLFFFEKPSFLSLQISKQTKKSTEIAKLSNFLP